MTANPGSLQRRLFLLAAAAIVPLAALAGVGLYFVTQHQRAQAERAGIDITRALSTAIDAELQRSLAALEAISTATLLDASDFERYHPLASRVVATRPHWSSVLVHDPQGNIVMDTARPLRAPIPGTVEPESLQRVIQTREPAVGPLARGVNLRHAFPVRVPVLREGKLLYVLTAVVRPDAIVEVVNRQRLPPDWVVSVFDSRLQRVARSRQHEQFVGQAPAPTLAELIGRGGDEGSGITRALEGDEIYTAFSRSRSTGWTVAIGMPAALVEAGARRYLVAFGGGLLLSLIVAGVAVLAVARGIARGEEERRQLLERAERAREDAEAASRAKDAFLAMLGHELRNPLGAIANAAQLLDHAPSADYGKSVIRRQVAHLSRMTDDLLDAGRAIAGKIQLQKEPLDLAGAAAQALSALRASGQLGAHRIEEALGSAWIDADPVRVEQIITNLVLNAVKYSPRGTAIRLATRREDDKAVLTISDEGIGMTPDLLARAFDPFVQGEHDLARSRGGLGLGLTLVRRLAEMHGGEALAASAGLGRGSEFTVRFPAIAAPREKTVQAPAKGVPVCREILVVEDNDDARESLKKLLELSGHRVRVAADGAAGLEEIRARAPQIAFIDIGLPQLDGYEVARRVRGGSDGHASPMLVALTGYGLPEDRSRALAAGFDAHLVKPVDPSALQEVLDRLG